MEFLKSLKIRLILITFVTTITLAGGSVKADFTFGTPTNLGPTVNSIYTEVGPSISSDGLSLYFSDLDFNLIRPGSYGGNDLWVTTRATTQDNWSAPVNLGPTVNGPYIDMEPCVSADGLTLYFNSDRPGGYGDFDIWMTRRSTKESDWETPVNLGPPINSSASETEPCISSDGLTLYFDSNRTGSFGDYDLYISSRPTKDDNWLEPVNLGQTINSQSFDRGASISSNGLALFLTSGRSYGYSYLWVTTRANAFEPWAAPINLGPIINRIRNQATANVSADGRTLLFTTNRRDGCGNYDIWQASIEPIVDFNGDGNIDTDDLLILIDNWNTSQTLCDIGPMPWGDGVVDMEDLTVFIRYWEQENFPDVNVDEDDDGGQVVFKQGQVLVVTLESNPSTGYSWSVVENQDSILEQVGESEFVQPEQSDPPMVGVGGWEVFRFKAVSTGQETLELIYRRSWETDVEPANTFTIEVVVN